jgi:hypothetical protein
MEVGNVRFGPKADLAGQIVMSALGLKAAIPGGIE